jgi:uncharacterized protein YueI
MDYQYLGKYIKLAMSHDIPYKIVLNKDHNSDLGLVLAESNAINKEEIYIEKQNHAQQVFKKKSFTAFFKRCVKKLLKKR